MKIVNDNRASRTFHPVWKIVLSGVILFGSVIGIGSIVNGAGSGQPTFQDTSKSFAKEAIARLVQKGIVAGTTEHTFEPKKAVTRAEFASFAVRLLGLEPVSNNIKPFADISAKAWYYGNVAAMTNLSILEGKGQNQFQPNASITREEAAALLVRMLKQRPVASDSMYITYADAADISSWALPYVQKVHQLGLMRGSSGMFRPADQVTREEAAVMLDSILQNNTWATQIQRKQDHGIQLGWQYNSSTAEFIRQVDQSPVNTVVPRWFFLNKDMNVSDHANATLISWASASGRALWPMLGNRSNKEMTHQMLSSSANREAVVNQVSAYVKKYKLGGINVDFENVDPVDREGFTAFVTSLTKSLHTLGAVVSVDVSPNLGSDWTAAFDYVKLGAISDYMVLMSYEEHWNGDPKPGSVASLPWVDRALTKMLSEVPRTKTILALPLYTRDWSTVNPAAASWDITLGEQGVRASASGSLRNWDTQLKQYMINYTSKSVARAIWAEESRSLSAKVRMSGERNIAGLAYWYMGGETADVWNAITNAMRFESYQF
ncbi:S-layer homology domain-containing protein [Paenibacillus cucumis (ex Kampfer et al. 2016)]|uniref:S-layer homology domain-containing protein n=1 Tax=Paenibacillus cucumis (ex Kampfer et al. 2016) TaxID=1776858 RepID=UPI00289BC913|nr:S-layer homology domain-containing protein [Paenibacillus cucumis (ex Kampfer et al. 2016)]